MNKWMLKSIATTTGFLERAPIYFSDGLTCVIGARGTCKSTIVETIRFAFDCDPDRVEHLIDATMPGSQDERGLTRGLVHATLGEGTVRCEIGTAGSNDDYSYTLERTIGSKPRIFQDGVPQVETGSLLGRIEIYSQGDLQRIAEQPARRLQLIDRPNQEEVDRLKDVRRVAAERLRELGPSIRRTRSEIESRKSTIRPLDMLRQELANLQGNRPQLSVELTAARDDYALRKTGMDRVRGAAAKWSEAVAEVEAVVAHEQTFRLAILDCTKFGSDQGNALAEAFSQLASVLSQASNGLKMLSAHPIGDLVEALRVDLEQQNTRYYALRREQQEVNDLLKKEDSLRSQVLQLEEAQRKLGDIEVEYDRLVANRRDLRAKIDDIGERLYQMRLQQVDSINESYGKVVLLTLQHGSRSVEQRTVLSILLAGSKIRNQDEIAAELAAKMRPSDVVDAIETGDAKRLADALDRDLGQMTRIVSHLLDNPKLYQLEGVVCDEQLDITLFVDGEPKPINQLSKGQMATALLPLILRDAPYPLIFDQPEDDLDNAFVFQTLIGQILKLKLSRQLIFITHNANIPVLGDAEGVIVMSMSGPRKAGVPTVGNVDEVKNQILTLLEGGREAFILRQQRYSDALTLPGAK